MAIAGTVAIAAALALSIPASAFAAPASNGTIVWNGASDKGVAVNIDNTPSNRTNASGPKITSNAHSADFPDIYFIWDSKQKDSGYLKVAAAVFDTFDSFTLTTKTSNTYTDFVITLQDGQVKTADGCYVFYIKEVANNKNINMVFVSNKVEKTIVPEPEPELIFNVGFIIHYQYGDNVLTTSIGWQSLAKDGDCIDWDAVDAAYADMVTHDYYNHADNGWTTSGYASLFYSEMTPTVCYSDLTAAQEEGYQASLGNHVVYFDAGYVVPMPPEPEPQPKPTEVTPTPTPTQTPHCNQNHGNNNCQGGNGDGDQQ